MVVTGTAVGAAAVGLGTVARKDTEVAVEGTAVGEGPESGLGVGAKMWVWVAVEGTAAGAASAEEPHQLHQSAAFDGGSRTSEPPAVSAMPRSHPGTP